MHKWRYFSRFNNTRMTTWIIHTFFICCTYIFSLLTFVYIFTLLCIQIFFKTRRTYFFRNFIDACEVPLCIETDLGFTITIILSSYTLIYVFTCACGRFVMKPRWTLRDIFPFTSVRTDSVYTYLWSGTRYFNNAFINV